MNMGAQERDIVLLVPVVYAASLGVGELGRQGSGCPFDKLGAGF